MRILEVRENDSGQRLDKFLSKSIKSMPQSLMYKLIRTKKIKVNRRRAEPKQMLAPGDTVQCFISEDFFSDENKPSSLFSVKPCLNILYEDKNILLLNKPVGVLCHEDSDGNTNTLIFHVQAYLAGKGEYSPDEELSFAPALCNRIDRNTSGIVIAAKNAAALRDMNERIKNGEVHKKYLCAVHGVPVPAEAVREAYLHKDPSTNTVKIYSERSRPRQAKKIKTGYRTLNTKDGISLLEIRLYTGRTHQIRAHMEYLGYPLVGEGKYGKNALDRARGYKHQALCSYSVEFAFEEKGSVLDYLSGKCVSIPRQDVFFVKELF